MKRELYPIHAWNGMANWVHGNLRQGQRVMVQGYLTQRTVIMPGEGRVTVSEVTAEEFFPASGDVTARANRQENTKQAEAANV